jgi:hypothetical protein
MPASECNEKADRMNEDKKRGSRKSEEPMFPSEQWDKHETNSC